MILCVAGNPSIDKLFEVDRLIAGDIHRPQEFVALPGGKGIHVAQVASALDAPAIVTGIGSPPAGSFSARLIGLPATPAGATATTVPLTL